MLRNLVDRRAVLQTMSAAAVAGAVAVPVPPDGHHGWLRLTPEKVVSWDFRKLAALAR